MCGSTLALPARSRTERAHALDRRSRRSTEQHTAPATRACAPCLSSRKNRSPVKPVRGRLLASVLRCQRASAASLLHASRTRRLRAKYSRGSAWRTVPSLASSLSAYFPDWPSRSANDPALGASLTLELLRIARFSTFPFAITEKARIPLRKHYGNISSNT